MSDLTASSQRTDADHLLAEVYNQLRAIAQARLATESPGHTLQATALVHEAWLRLSMRGADVQSMQRGQFVWLAAEAMRRVLIDHARGRRRVKRGGDGSARRVPADVADLANAEDGEQIMALDEAIRRFEAQDPRAAQIVKLRFFAGLSIAETAESLGLSQRTVKREWQHARAWLFHALS